MKKTWKRLIAILAAMMMLVCAAPVMAEEAPQGGGTIMWLSNLTAGIQYETTIAYLTAICDELGYKLTVVYGDGFNDAAGNLQAVKNGMTNDVVGMIASQDGGLLSIMEEFPDLYVAGYCTDMNSVFSEGGENAGCLEKDHFLGTIADGYINGEDTAQSYFNTCLEKGFRKVAVIDFPGFAYPNLEVASRHFVELVNAYNETAADDDKFEIMGDATTLMFTPLEDSWFLENGHDSLDAIIAACAGIMFVYPTMATAIANGMCSPDTKLITGGFDTDPSIISNVGDSEGKVITSISFSPAEDPAYSLILLDNAITGNQYDDFEVTRIDGFEYIIDSDEDIDNAMTKGMVGTGDPALAQIPVDMVVNELCKRNNPDATFAQLQAVFHDPELISVDALANR